MHIAKIDLVLQINDKLPDKNHNNVAYSSKIKTNKHRSFDTQLTLLLYDTV